MNVLFVATRSPWPSADGGRVLMARTLDALRSSGHTVTVVAPTLEAPHPALTPDGSWLHIRLVPVGVRSRASSLARAVLPRTPGSVLRHHHPEVAAVVSDLLDREVFDLVHVEQLHALTHVDPSATGGVPVLLRAENVESDLWRQTAASRWWRRPAAWEARRLARFERDAMRRVAVTVALTEPDAARLRGLSPGSRVDVVRAPMPAELPPGTRTLDGAPAIALLSSRWFPNRDGAAWFLRHIWPEVAASLPGARLHVFGHPHPGVAGVGVVAHPAPPEQDDASVVFARGSIFVVPLGIASGVRMRILEAWARGIPVVATPAAAAGLDVHEPCAVSIARTPAEFTRAFRALSASQSAVDQAVAAGRAVLRNHHDPSRLALDLDRIYRAAVAQPRSAVKPS